MTDTTEMNIIPVRPLGEVQALDWLRAQPGGSTTLPAAALARRWGWPEHRARRRLNAWQRTGLVRRRGRVVTAVANAVDPTPDPTPDEATLEVVGKASHRVEVGWKNSPSVRLAAQAAGQACELIEFPSDRRSVEVFGKNTADTPFDRPVIPAPAGPPPARRQAGRGRVVVLVATALSLATVSAWYSITGMTSIFVGAFWPVIALGIALEAGKLCAVAALPTLHLGPLKVALTALVAILMGLNAIGAYGFLSRAQIEHSVIGDAAIEAREAQVRAKLDVQAGVVADLEKRIGQIDAAVMTATLKGRAKGAMQIADDQRRNRADLVRERQHQADALADMKAEAAGLSAQRRVAAAELGPVRYLATLLGAGDQDVLRWFILVVAMLLDPAAVLLLLAAASARRS
jgi:hypothetical protein